MDASGELQCVGRLEIEEPVKPVGFLCGSLPVPTDGSAPGFRLFPTTPNPAGAPRYQMLPAETDLNKLPVPSNLHEKVFPASDKSNEGVHWQSSPEGRSVSRKCEALAVSGLAEYGDELDVVAPVDILKQIFKIPYSKAQLSIAVHRIGDTLILNAGPNYEEGEKMFRRQANQTKGSSSSIFLNFAMHSVRAEACDCPPSHNSSPGKRSSSTMLPGHFGHRESSFMSSSMHCGSSQNLDQLSRKKSSQSSHDKFVIGTQHDNQKRTNPTERSSQIGQMSRHPVQEPDKQKKVGDNGFLRVLLWQFHNFRMLLGSDLLIFSNDKFVAVSLHLWDVARQVSPLIWLEAWLDNVMASVPEMAICYHRNGVVQGYELLKTDDIFLLKGVSDDGTPAFHPQIVQQHGLSVLRFLQDNCKQDPGAYWLYKSSGEDVMQLFDLSVMPKNHSVDDRDVCGTSLASLLHRERRESLFSLGTVLYRVAHRLSLSKAPDKRARCAKFFKKCLDFLTEKDHLVVRAYAHEQFARLILSCYEELDLTSESFLLESEVMVTDIEDESIELSVNLSESIRQITVTSETTEGISLVEDGAKHEASGSNMESISKSETDLSGPLRDTLPGLYEGRSVENATNGRNNHSMVMSYEASTQVGRTIVDPVTSKLAAIHHVSQAIKSLRWKRQLQSSKGDMMDYENNEKSPLDLSLCTCGDADCIEVCDIREWLTKCKMDHKLWNLILLLGESYLALAEAYKEDGQLFKALKVMQVASLVYGSMPQHLDDAHFISSMVTTLPAKITPDGRNERHIVPDGTRSVGLQFSEDRNLTDKLPSTRLFWGKAWTLVGDVYVDYCLKKGKVASVERERMVSGGELRMSHDVVREVNRLKKKLGECQQNCSTCSLVNCSCHSDRANSGSSASSSNGDATTSYTRKHGRKTNMRNTFHATYSSRRNDVNLLRSDNHSYDKVIQNRGAKTSPIENSGHKDICVPPCSLEDKDILRKETTIKEAVCSDSNQIDESKLKHGGIFKFLDGPQVDDVENNMLAAMTCFQEAIRVMSVFPNDSPEIHSVLKKKGWICNELGRFRLENKNLAGAEVAFTDAKIAFREVSDYTNIILINCNLGHGRRALAEELVLKLDEFEKYNILQHAYKEAMKTAKSEYLESLKFYAAAKDELSSIRNEGDVMLTNEVHTQYANTYLRLGMLLARGQISAESFTGGHGEEKHNNGKSKELSKHEMSAGDAFREALCMYESLGDLRRQEAAYTHFQLACYQKDCCLRFLNLDQKQVKNMKLGSNCRQKAKWYASLAEKNWQKSMEFYGPKTHRMMYINILLEQSSLSVSLSSLSHSNSLLETALLHLLQGRNVVEENGDGLFPQNTGIVANFWSQLQIVLKSMLTASLLCSKGKSGDATQPVPSSRAGDSVKLKEMYRISLKSPDMTHLHAMYKLWIS